MIRRILALVTADARNTVRDPLLLVMTALPGLAALALRFGAPQATRRLRGSFDLEPYLPFLVSGLVLMAPMLYGWWAGFLLLEDRDEHMIPAIAVSPLGRQGYLAYRLGLPTVLSSLLGLLVVAVADLAWIPWPRLVALVLIASLEAPIMATVLGAYAGNKVEGLALGKALTPVAWTPFAILFVPSPWQALFALLPPYWVSRLFLAGEASWSAYSVLLTAALAVHLGWLMLGVRRFIARMD